MIERVDVETVAARTAAPTSAAFIGSTEDPGFRAALDEMLGELYGAEPQS